jgi:hypothetical protein
VKGLGGDKRIRSQPDHRHDTNARAAASMIVNLASSSLALR